MLRVRKGDAHLGVVPAIVFFFFFFVFSTRLSSARAGSDEVSFSFPDHESEADKLRRLIAYKQWPFFGAG